MSAAAMAADDEGKLVGKYALAKSLGWTRDRLDRRIEADPDFPIVERGGGAGERWQFDLDAVRAYLANADSAESDKVTPRQRREIAQAEAIERKNREAAGELIEVAPFRDDIGLMFARLGKSFDELGLEIVKRLGLPAEAHQVVQELVDERRRQMIADMDQYLADDDEEDGEDE